MQANVGDVKIAYLVVPAKTAGRIHHRHVNARLLQLLDFFHRQVTHIAPVLALIGGKPPHVDTGGQFAQLVELVTTDRAFELARGVVVATVVGLFFFSVGSRRAPLAPSTHLLQKSRQGGRFNAQELHIKLGRIDRDHRQAAVLASRQHHAAAGKIKRHRHGFALDFAFARCAQCGTTSGRQRRRQRDTVGALRRDIRQVEHARVVAQHPARFYRLGGLGLVALAGLEQFGPVLRPGHGLGETQGDGGRTIKQAGLAIHKGKRLGGANLYPAGIYRITCGLPPAKAGRETRQCQQGQQDQLCTCGHAASLCSVVANLILEVRCGPAFTPPSGACQYRECAVQKKGPAAADPGSPSRGLTSA